MANAIGITQPCMLTALRAYLLTLSAVTNLVGQRVFTHSIPKGNLGTDCIVLSSIPSVGSDPNSPITKLSFMVQCFSLSKSTALSIERVAVFPNLHGYEAYISSAWMSAVQSQSSFLLLDPDHVPEYWISNSEYDITLRY